MSDEAVAGHEKGITVRRSLTERSDMVTGQICRKTRKEYPGNNRIFLYYRVKKIIA
jgi:hypothetical protein